MIEILRESLMITSFVAVMLMVIEYVNVMSRGKWQKHLAGSRARQYFTAALLGVIPGCLGAFAVVAMYQHGILSLGAVVAAMIATAGDETFVMLAMIPEKVPLILGSLFLLGIFAGALSDIFFKKRGIEFPSKVCLLEIHSEYSGDCALSWEQTRRQWKKPTFSRTILTVVLGLVIIAILAGDIGPRIWNWIRLTLLMVNSVAFFIVATVPDHFLESHLWKHVFKQHVPRIFLWTFGTLLLLFMLTSNLDIEPLLQKNLWVVLFAAAFVGIIPQSGPHLVLVTLFAKGIIPLSVLMASSVVQDGHGMLPLLARSRKDFISVKVVNLIVGLLFGGILMFFGY